MSSITPVFLNHCSESHMQLPSTFCAALSSPSIIFLVWLSNKIVCLDLAPVKRLRTAALSNLTHAIS